MPSSTFIGNALLVAAWEWFAELPKIKLGISRSRVYLGLLRRLPSSLMWRYRPSIPRLNSTGLESEAFHDIHDKENQLCLN